MSARIAAIIEDVIEREGGFVDHADDRGGATRWGITEREARADGYEGPMSALPMDRARSIYRRKYVLHPKYDEVLPISEPIAEELIDTCVLMGQVRAGSFLQRCLNVFNQQQATYDDVVVDGDIGPASRRALAAFIERRGRMGIFTLCFALNALQTEFLIDLAERDPSQETFVLGQIAKRAAYQFAEFAQEMGEQS